MAAPHILHVLHIPDPSAIGGAEIQALQLMELIIRDGLRVSACILTDYHDSLYTQILTEKNIPYVFSQEVRHLTDRKYISNTIATFRGQKPDLLHVHNTYFSASPYISLIALLAGIRTIVITEHSNFPQFPSLLGRIRKSIISHSVNYTVAVSNAVRDTLITQYKYSSSRLRVIRNAMHVDAISKRVKVVDRNKVRQDLGIPFDSKLIVSVANLRREKGTAILLEAFVRTLKDSSNCRLLLVGEGPERQALENQIKKDGLEDLVILAGWKADVIPYLASSDLFVLPSLIEGLPLTIIEAMAAGCPIVATAVGGTPEIITDNETGLLVESGNAVEISKAMNLILNDPILAKRLGRSAQETALRNSRIEDMARAYQNLYMELGIGL